MLKVLIVAALLIAVPICSAGTGKLERADGLSAKELDAIIERCENDLPRLWQQMNTVREDGVNIRISNRSKMGPGLASGTSQIVLGARFLQNDLPQFPEDRLIILLFHEYGHIRFNREVPRNERNRVKNEFFAFAYSLKMAQKLAQNGDFGPLEQVIKNLKLRSEKGKPKDPHTIAINQLIETPIWTNATAALEGL